MAPTTSSLRLHFHLRCNIPGFPPFALSHHFASLRVQYRQDAASRGALLHDLVCAAHRETILRGVPAGTPPMTANALRIFATNHCWRNGLDAWTQNDLFGAHIPLGTFGSIAPDCLLSSLGGTEHESDGDLATFHLGLSGSAPPELFSTTWNVLPSCSTQPGIPDPACLPIVPSLPDHLRNSALFHGLHTWGVDGLTLENARFSREPRGLPIMVRETECMESVLLQCGLMSTAGTVTNPGLAMFMSMGQYNRDSMLSEFGWSPQTFKTRLDWFKRARKWVKDGRRWVEPAASSPGTHCQDQCIASFDNVRRETVQSMEGCTVSVGNNGGLFGGKVTELGVLSGQPTGLCPKHEDNRVSHPFAG